MEPVKTLKDILPTDPVNILARLVPGAGLVLIAALTWDAFALHIPTDWETRPLILIGFAIAAWVLGMFLSYAAHILNTPYDWLVQRRRDRDGDPKLERVKFVAGDLLGRGDDVYAFAETAVATSKSPELLGSTRNLQAISKLFRTLCLAALVAFVWGVFTAASWAVIFGAALMAVLSWQVFYDHRWAATQAVYQAYLALKGQT